MLNASVVNRPLPEDVLARRPFDLVLYFTVICLILSLFFALTLASLMGMRTSSLVLYKKEQYAILLAENLNHQVMLRFVRPTIRDHQYISVGRPEQTALLDQVVKNTIHPFQVKRVNIMDLRGNIIYSTEPEYVGRIISETGAFILAANGRNVSFLDPAPNIFEIAFENKSVFKIFTPMRDERLVTSEMGEPTAVFEITLDVSEDFHEVWINQAIMIVFLLVLMALFFVLLRSIVIRGYRIMDRQGAERIKLEEQLNQNERLAALGRMIAGVAHEIRNPLGIVRSTAELLAAKSESLQRKLANVIVEESSRLNQVVSEFLDFAKPQKAQLQPGQINELINRLIVFLGPEFLRLDVRVETENQFHDALILMDEEQIYRALLNIATNSLQSMEKTINPVLSIRVDKGKDFLTIIVEDNGPGFPLEYLPRFFEPFFTTKDNGTGLGLSIVKTTIEAHGGRIELGKSQMGGAQVVLAFKLYKE